MLPIIILYVLLLNREVYCAISTVAALNDTFLFETYPDYSFYTLCTCSTCWWNETRGVYYKEWSSPKNKQSFCTWLDFSRYYKNQYEYENFNVHYPMKIHVRDNYTIFNSSHISYDVTGTNILNNTEFISGYDGTTEGRLFYMVYSMKYYLDAFYPNESISWRLKADWIINNITHPKVSKECTYYDMNIQKFMYDGCTSNYSYMGFYREDGWLFRLYNVRLGAYYYIDYKLSVIQNTPIRTNISNMTYPYYTDITAPRDINMDEHNYVLTGTSILLVFTIIYSGVYSILCRKKT